MTDREKATDLRKLPRHEQNPFLRDYASKRPRYSIGTEEKHLVIQRNDEDPTRDTAIIIEKKAIDREPFVKLYTKGAAMVADLSKAGQKVFAVLIAQASQYRDEHKLHLTYEIAERTMRDLTRSVWQRGLKELTEKNIVGRTPITGLWWLNPDILFNGNRIEIRQIYIRRSTTEQLDIEDYIDLTPAPAEETK